MNKLFLHALLLASLLVQPLWAHAQGTGLQWRRSGHDIYYRLPGELEWQHAPGTATAVGDGWVIGTDETNGGYAIYRWNGSDWDREPGGAIEIGGSYFNPWVVNDRGERFSWDGYDWRPEGYDNRAQQRVYVDSADSAPPVQVYDDSVYIDQSPPVVIQEDNVYVDRSPPVVIIEGRARVDRRVPDRRYDNRGRDEHARVDHMPAAPPVYVPARPPAVAPARPPMHVPAFPATVGPVHPYVPAPAPARPAAAAPAPAPAPVQTHVDSQDHKSVHDRAMETRVK